MKVCNVCNKELPLSSFHKKRNSHEGFCKVCKEAKRKARSDADPSIIARRAEIHKNRTENDPDYGVRRRRYAVGYYQRNRAKQDAATRKWNKDNPDKRLAMHRKWQQANKDRVRYHANKRRTAKLRATPKWAEDEWEQFFVTECYNLAVVREQETGFAWHVDHIVPLQSKLVCGLHCASNLRVLPGAENMSKGNRHWPDMW